jgi:hypothetical protein
MSEDDSGIWKNVGPADGNLAVHGLKIGVKAIDNSGNYSTGAATAEITVIIVPSAPTGLTAEQDAGRLVLVRILPGIN